MSAGADELRILLTNDDGIDAAGLRALHDALSELGEVTVVAPAADHSGLGRVLSYGRPVPLRTGDRTDEMDLDDSFSYRLEYTEGELGYAVEGTPCDCVVAGVCGLEPPDVVVSGCNPGVNVGTSTFGRSGTVSAAMEAAYLGIPSLAVSAAPAADGSYDFELPVEFARRLLAHALETGVFDRIDFMNTVIPSEDLAGAELTRPAEGYVMDAALEDDAFRLRHSTMERTYGEIDHDAPPGTDLHAVREGVASISPLELPHVYRDDDALAEFAAQW